MLSNSKLEKLDLAIGKCFAKAHLSDEDIEVILTASDEEFYHNMNLLMDQVRTIKIWCQIECQRKWAQAHMTGCPEDRMQHVSPYAKYSYRGYRT
jgi:hypothetical protein